jgi:acetyl-CoA carboxylase carboxyl transferase subunit beta
MLKDLFGKPKYVTVKRSYRSKKQEEFPDNGLWTRCKNCKELIFNKKLEENLMVCPKCGYHFRINARNRIKITLDNGSFHEFAEELYSIDPLDFPGYKEKLEKSRDKTSMTEAVIVGGGSINGYHIIIAVMDFDFMGGSMGSVVGEKITLAIEKAIQSRKSLVIFSTAGGARMQEGMLSLMQMAKTSAAIKRLNEFGLLFLSVLTDPTSGGVTASFASLGDIIIAEPGALIAFAGPRVIKQTISTNLPEGFQRAEFLLEHGMIDLVVPRDKLRDEIAKILKIHHLEVNNYV